MLRCDPADAKEESLSTFSGHALCTHGVPCAHTARPMTQAVLVEAPQETSPVRFDSPTASSQPLVLKIRAQCGSADSGTSGTPSKEPSDVSASLVRDAVPTSLATSVNESTWAEIWDACAAQSTKAAELRAQQDELVLDVEQECPLGCCLSAMSKEYEDWYNSYLGQTQPRAEAGPGGRRVGDAHARAPRIRSIFHFTVF